MIRPESAPVYDHNVDEHKADQHDKGIHTDLGRDLRRLRLESLKLQLFHVVREHLKIDAPVIPAQDADEPAHDVGEHG